MLAVHACILGVCASFANSQKTGFHVNIFGNISFGKAFSLVTSLVTVTL
jgi:hypothetical protein